MTPPSPLTDAALDALLAGFFRAELPHPWPALDARRVELSPAPEPLPRDRGPATRPALAVCALIAAGTCWATLGHDAAPQPVGQPMPRVEAGVPPEWRDLLPPAKGVRVP